MASRADTSSGAKHDLLGIRRFLVQFPVWSEVAGWVELFRMGETLFLVDNSPAIALNYLLALLQ